MQWLEVYSLDVGSAQSHHDDDLGPSMICVPSTSKLKGGHGVEVKATPIEGGGGGVGNKHGSRGP